MDVRPLFTLLLLSSLLLAGCATVEEPQTAPGRERGEPSVEEAAETAPEKEREEQEVAAPAAPPEQLFPANVYPVGEAGRPLRRTGDFDGDGVEDDAFLGVRGSRITVSALRDERRLYDSPATASDAYALVRLGSGESLILPVGELFLLAEFDTLSLTSGQQRAKGDLLYLRLETREQQRHLLISVNPAGPSLQRYLFLTDSLTGFFYRDVDGNGEVEIVHVENQVTAAGVEESYYTLYQLVDQRLERRSRTPVVAETNKLLSETRRLLLSGERKQLLSRYASDPSLDVSAYFSLQEGAAIERVSDPEFVYVPELRSNPFDLREEPPRLQTEILLLSEGVENLYALSLGLLVPPNGSPEIRLLPTAPSAPSN